ncbi:2-hydroxyacyl-CoA dehydratase family protein, partial [Patescibacteria group bacterium]|nr:2-hydroxyacyl-CoA dehydratase family protein [Patescibacteria group bacterium]
MSTDRKARVSRTAALHLAMESEEMLRRIEGFPDNPVAMGYFYDLFRSRGKGESRPSGKGKAVGTLCVQVPEELIRACGARPVRLCSGAQAHESVGAEIMPAKSCPLVKATLGMLESGGQLEDLCGIVVPTTCDQKRKMASLLASHGYPVHLLEMPPVKDSEGARFYWQESVKELALTLEKWTGVRLNRKSVQAAILERSQASRVFQQLYALQCSQPAPLAGKDLLLVANSYFFDDINCWRQAVATLCMELEARVARGQGAGARQAPRILFTGSPPIFPNLKVPVLVEEAGAVIVADELCSSARLLHDQAIIGEGTLADMIPALADRALKPCTCPCLADNRDRERRLLTLADDYQVDGVIYQAFSGCLPYELEQRQIGAGLAQKGVPMLYVETDYSP